MWSYLAKKVMETRLRACSGTRVQWIRITIWFIVLLKTNVPTVIGDSNRTNNIEIKWNCFLWDSSWSRGCTAELFPSIILSFSAFFFRFGSLNRRGQSRHLTARKDKCWHPHINQSQWTGHPPYFTGKLKRGKKRRYNLKCNHLTALFHLQNLKILPNGLLKAFRVHRSSQAPVALHYTEPHTGLQAEAF